MNSTKFQIGDGVKTLAFGDYRGFILKDRTDIAPGCVEIRVIKDFCRFPLHRPPFDKTINDIWLEKDPNSDIGIKLN